MKYVYKYFPEGEALVGYLNDLEVNQLNHTLEGVWGTPIGIYAVVVFWEEEPN